VNRKNSRRGMRNTRKGEIGTEKKGGPRRRAERGRGNNGKQKPRVSPFPTSRVQEVLKGKKEGGVSSLKKQREPPIRERGKSVKGETGRGRANVSTTLKILSPTVIGRTKKGEKRIP